MGNLTLTGTQSILLNRMLLFVLVVGFFHSLVATELRKPLPKLVFTMLWEAMEC